MGKQKVKIKLYKNTPMLHINGKAIPFLAFFGNVGDVGSEQSENSFQEIKMVSEIAGLHIHSINIDFPWKEKSKKYDYTKFDDSIYNVLKSDPQAMLILRMRVSPPEKLLKQYSGEEILFDDKTKMSVSLGSKKWLSDASRNLKALINHINKTNYCNSIISFHLTHLECGEWFYFQPDKFADYSKVYTKAFQKYLRNKYRTEKKMSVEWKKKSVTFDKVTIPSSEQRKNADLGVFHTSMNGSYIKDFYEFHNNKVADTIIHFAKLVKKETRGRILTAFFYGYLFEIINNFPTGPQNSGHYALKKILDCPDINILVGPISYYERWEKAELGCSYYMSPVDSVHLHNKLWLNEDDTRTYLAGKSAIRKNLYDLGSCSDLNNTIQVMRRNFANMLLHSAGCWWMDLPGEGWWKQKEICEEIDKLKKIYEKWISISSTCRYFPEVAVIIDEKSMYTQSENNELMMLLLYRQRYELARLGTSYGFYLFSDLTAGLIPDTKVYIFLNVLDVNAQERKYIDKNLKKRNKTLVWIYASGFLKDGVPDKKNIQSLTGIQVEMIKEEMMTDTIISKHNKHPIVKGLEIEKFGGDLHLSIGPVYNNKLQIKISPTFYITDRYVDILGNYIKNAQPSFGIKNVNDCNSIFIGTPIVSYEVLRSICKYAGVHLYLNKGEDIIFARDNFIAIHSQTGGEQIIFLPKSSDVYDLIEKKVIGKSLTKFEIKMNKFETKLFSLGWTI